MLDLLAKGGPFFLADLRGAEVGITPAEADAILQAIKEPAVIGHVS